MRGGGGGATGSGSFVAGPLLSGIAGNQNDTTSAAPVAGAMIFGNATPLWARLAIGTAGQVLTVVAGLPAWAAATGGVTSFEGRTGVVVAVAGDYGPTKGGTGQIAVATGDLLYGSAADTWSRLAVGTNTHVLTLTAGLPVWAAPVVTSVFGRTGIVVAVAGDYDATKGGTGQTTVAVGDILYGSGVNTWSKLAAGTNGFVLTLAAGIPSWAAGGSGAAQWESAGGNWQAIASGLTAGDTFKLVAKETDSAAAVGCIIDSGGTLSTAGSKLLSVRNNTTEKVFVAFDGTIQWVSSAGDAGFIGYTGARAFSVTSGQTGETGGLYIERWAGDDSSGARLQANGTDGTAVLYTAGGTGGSIGIYATQAAGVIAGKLLFLDGAVSGSYNGLGDTPGDSGISKSTGSGGNFSFMYDGTETLRDDGTNWRALHSRKPGGYTAIADANPVCRYGGNNKVNSTAVGNTADNNEDTLITYTLPASQLTATGDRLRVVSFGTTAANATLKRIRLYCGGTVVFDTTAQAFSAVDWRIEAEIVRTGAATQIAIAFFSGSTALVPQTATYTTPAETLSGTIVIKTTSQSTATGAADDTVNKGLLVDVFPVGA